MFIAILDYNRESVSIINDEENVTAGLQTDDIEIILNAVGFHGSEISYMVTKENPLQPVKEYITLRECLADLDEDKVQELQDMVDADWEALDEKTEEDTSH